MQCVQCHAFTCTCTTAAPVPVMKGHSIATSTYVMLVCMAELHDQLLESIKEQAHRATDGGRKEKKHKRKNAHANEEAGGAPRRRRRLYRFRVALFSNPLLIYC